jgi:hypothetical protein
VPRQNVQRRNVQSQNVRGQNVRREKHPAGQNVRTDKTSGRQNVRRNKTSGVTKRPATKHPADKTSVGTKCPATKHLSRSYLTGPCEAIYLLRNLLSVKQKFANTNTLSVGGMGGKNTVLNRGSLHVFIKTVYFLTMPLLRCTILHTTVKSSKTYST